MSYHMKKEHLKNWDLQQTNRKSRIDVTNLEDDDQDIYISERSSITSSNDTSQLINPVTKRLPTPIPSSRLILSRKTPHSLRYAYNDLPENGVPVAVQYQLQRKDDKKNKKNLRKAPPGQGTLVPLPQVKPPESADHYYPYWYYYKLKNPDWIMHQRRGADGQIIPYDSVDPLKYMPPPSPLTSPIKPNKRTRKSRHKDAPPIPSNQDKQRYDYSEKTSSPPSHGMVRADHQQPLPRQYIPLKDADNNEHREQQMKRQIVKENRKLKTDNEWTDHYLQSMSNKPPQDLTSLMVTSNAIANRSKIQSKILDKYSTTSNMHENGKYRHHQNDPHKSSSQQNHHHHTQKHFYNSPSIPSQQNHAHSHHHHHHHHHGSHAHPHNPSSVPSEQNHYYQTHSHLHNIPHNLSQHDRHPDHYQQHLHIRRRPSSGTYVDSDIQIVDITSKDPVHDTYRIPASILYKQTSHLPLIMPNNYHRTTRVRDPNEYYGTLTRQINHNNGQNSISKTNIYKPDLHARFPNYRVHNIVDKRLAA